MSNYSFYKIVVTHIPSCVLNWKIEKHMSSCGHRHKTTKVKHVRDTQLPTTSLDLTHEVGRTFLYVWNFSSVSSNWITLSFRSVSERNYLLMREKMPSVDHGVSQLLFAPSQLVPQTKPQTSQLVPKRNTKQVKWSHKAPKQSTGPKRNPKQFNRSHKRNPKHCNKIPRITVAGTKLTQPPHSDDGKTSGVSIDTADNTSQE